MELIAPREILVRGPNWVGDLVMTTPGLRALRFGFPDARISLQLRPGLESLMGGCPHVDAIIPIRSYHRGAGALIREGVELRRQGRFDLGICIPESCSSAQLQRIAGVRHIVGYAGGARRRLLHREVAVPSAWGPRRMVARELFVLGLMDAVGCKERGTQLQLFCSPDEDERVEAVLSEHAVVANEPLVILAPGASFGSSKRWPAESYGRVGDAMAREGARVVLLGGASEARIVSEVGDAMSLSPIKLAGVLSLGEVKALIRRAALMICNDAGARHIAAAFEVPSIVFFGPTSLEKTSLNLDGIEVLQTEDGCRPCYERTCPIDHRCMRGIDPSRVIPVALETLRRRA
jgi:heptosyltransferase-2